MSAVAEVQTLNGHISHNSSSNKSTFNSWTENKKIKTCKCTVCDERVRVSSQKCDGCGRHVCSDCLEPSSNKDAYYKAAAQNRMEVGCWACNWRSNMNPAFARRKPAPEVRTEEERKARASKALGARRKAAKQKSRVSKAEDTAGETARYETDAGFGSAGDAYTDDLTFDTSAGNKVIRQRAGIKRKRYVEDDSDDPDLFIQIENEALEKNAKKQAKQGGYNSKRHDADPHADRRTSVEKLVGRSEISPLSDTPQLPADVSVAPHLENRSTVIVGAGVVGLFVAYQLALAFDQEGINHNITVIDIRENVCELASGSCAGILSTSGMPEAWSQIAEEAQNYWEELQANNDFLYNIELGTSTLFRVENEGGQSTKRLPPGFNETSLCSLVDDVESFGRVNTRVLASWLYSQCKDLNVGFLFNHNVYDTEFSTDFNLTHVFLEDGTGKNNAVPCQNLVLVAGAFTTGIFDNLFPNSDVGLENHIRNAHWFIVPLKNVPKTSSVALRVTGAAKGCERLEDDINMLLHSTDRTITVSAMSLNKVSGNLEPKHAREPSIGKTSDLRQIASKYLNHEDLDVTDQKTHFRQGASQLSTANGHNPIIDRVPASGLGLGCSVEADSIPCGVWLCYGFGSHGTTLAPGAARILISRMFHGANGLDNYDFSLPEYTKPKLAGKGKCRAVS